MHRLSRKSSRCCAVVSSLGEAALLQSRSASSASRGSGGGRRREDSGAPTSLPPVQYSFEDFLSRLERSPEHHLHPLYTENSLLFESRPDMFIRALGSVSWRRACTLLSAARYRQTLPVSAYRTCLAQMVKHNRSVGCEEQKADDERGQQHHQACDWRVAFSLVADAYDRFGAEVPSRMFTSALRCCVPTHNWEGAIQLVKHRVKVLHDYEQLVAFPQQRRAAASNNNRSLRALFYLSQLPRHTLVEATLACATEASWVEALQVLGLCAAATPDTFYLPSTGSQHRPNPHSLLPPNPGQDDALRSERQLPSGESAGLQLLSNDLTSLIVNHRSATSSDSTPFLSLSQPERNRVVEMLCHVASVCPESVVAQHPLLRRVLPYVLTLGHTTQDGSLLTGSSGETHLAVADEFQVGYLEPTKELQAQQRLLSLCLRRATWTSALAALFPTSVGGGAESTSEGPDETRPKKSKKLNKTSCPKISYTPAVVAALLQKLPLEALQSSSTTEGPTAQQGANVGCRRVVPWLKRRLPRSVLLHRDVTTTLLHRYISAGNIQGALAFLLPSKGSPAHVDANGGGDSTSNPTSASSSGQGGAPSSSDMPENNLALSGAPLDSTLASTLVLHLWHRGEAKRCVELLAWCARTKSRLSTEAMVGGMECVAKESMVRFDRDAGGSSTRLLYPADAVHWRTALSWAVDLPIRDPHAAAPNGGVSTNTASTALNHPSRALGSAATPPLHPRVLSILVFLCAGHGSPHGALRALSYARAHGADAGGRHGVDIRNWKALEAVLFCGMYGRPEEAAAIVAAQHDVRTPAEVDQLAKLVALMFPM